MNGLGSRLAIVLLLSALTLSAHAQLIPLPFRIYTVNVRTGSDGNSGLNANEPFKTITKALSVAEADDYIYVYPGSYQVASGESFPLNIPSGVKLIGWEGPQMTSIDGIGANKPLIVFSGASSSTVLRGFTIRNGDRVGTIAGATSWAGGVTCQSGSAAIIEGNWIVQNESISAPGTSNVPNGGHAEGAGVYVHANSTCTIRNNVIGKNVSRGGAGYSGLAGGNGGEARGGGIVVHGAAVVTHNTIYGNYALGGKGGNGSGAAGGKGGNAVAGGAYFAPAATVANNIFFENTATAGGGGLGSPNGAGGTVVVSGMTADGATVTHNLIFGNKPLAAPQPFYMNTVVADPQLRGFEGRIPITSPARGNATNVYAQPKDLLGVTRPAAAALGAYEPVTRFDANRDDNADLIWRHLGNGDNAVWLMDGTTVLSASLTNNFDPAWTLAGTGDFNRDGHTDILWRHPGNGQNAIWYLNGAAVTSTFTIQTFPTNWTVAAVADFNGDGAADILWRDPVSFGNQVWFMSNGGVLRKETLTWLPNQGWSVAGTADFTNDGGADILWRNANTGETQMWRLTSWINDEPIYAAPAESLQWIVAAVGDFSGDGDADILWRNTSTGENRITNWHVYTGQLTKTETTQVGDLLWSVVKCADFNGDGRHDLLWRHSATGELAVWLMDGPTVLSATVLPVAVADANWKVAR